MGLNETQSAERVHIGFFGMRNAGKSSLVNRVTNQDMSLVSDVKGTTTDPVKKSMELLPLGPVTIIDTPGFDDEGTLGELRVARTKEVLAVCDIAVLVTEGDKLSESERGLLSLIEKRGVPYIVAHNKTDISGIYPANTPWAVIVENQQFMQGWLMHPQVWPKVVEMAIQNRADDPF